MSAEFRDPRLDEVAARLAALDAEAWAPPQPPPLDLDGALAARPAAVATRRRLLPALRPVVLRPVAAFTAAAALLVAGGTGGALLRGGGGDAGPAAPTGPSVSLAALSPSAPAGERAVVALPRRPGGDADLRATGLPPTPPGRFYEVWLMTDGARLASVGTFRVGADGRAHVRFHLGVDPRRYRYVDISLEHDDGDPAHSAESVLRSAPLT